MDSKEKLIIVGISTTAVHAYDFIKMYELYDVIGFAVNQEYRTCDTFCGLPVYSIEDLHQQIEDQNFSVFVALLWNRLNKDRKNLYDSLKREGYKFANLISPHAIIRGKLLGDNCWIHDYVIIQSNAQLHSNIAVMAYTLIGADTVVNSHCFFGAKSVLGGGSRVGEQCFIGINAIIFDETTIGNKCIVGACTAVKRNIPDYSLYKTSSELIDVKQYQESEIESKLMFSKNKR